MSTTKIHWFNFVTCGTNKIVIFNDDNDNDNDNDDNNYNYYICLGCVLKVTIVSLIRIILRWTCCLFYIDLNILML